MLVRLADAGVRVALVLLALARTSNPAFGGELVAALIVPDVVAAPAIGALADRIRHGRAFQAVCLAGFGTTSIALCALAAGRIPNLVVLGIAAAGGCLAPVIAGGLTGLLRDLVPPARAMLVSRDREAPAHVHTQVFSLAAGLRITFAAVGAALAGLLAGVGASGLLLGVAACQLAGAVLGGLLLRHRAGA